MSEPNVTESEERGSPAWHSIYRVPKKNHDAMVQFCKQFNEMFKKFAGLRIEVFQLANTNLPMEGITNIANTISANQDEEVWVELQYFRDRKHMDEVITKMGKDENMGRICKESSDLLTPGTRFIMGEFNRIDV
jgi:uncharacterized protein YbaA (DUF1428 family)